ncbi:MAG: hypothetical protein F6J93_13970 [Oscillatoria sp. SIO1A7]|nr:hypothetical protein [Oscillatoria sp. SIO1A7]
MTDTKSGQMTWKPNGLSSDSLHLRTDPSQDWRIYKEFPEYVLPDPPGFSDGYATCLALLKKNWQLL